MYMYMYIYVYYIYILFTYTSLYNTVYVYNIYVHSTQRTSILYRFVIFRFPGSLSLLKSSLRSLRICHYR